MNDRAGVTPDGKVESGTPRGGRVDDREPERSRGGLHYCDMWRRSPGPAARVPDLIGLEVRVAQDLALDAGVLAVDAGPHRSHVHAGVVTGQVPSAGRRVRVGSRV